MKAFPLRACGMAVGAAVLLGGCSSLPLGDVPIVDRSVPTSGEHTTAGSQSSSFAPLGDVRDSGRTHTVTVGDTIYNISVRYGVTPSALMQLNAVTDPTQLAIGRVLHIPESTAAPREVTMPEGVRVNRIEHVAPIEAAAVSPAAGSSSSGDQTSTGSVPTPTAPTSAAAAPAAEPAPAAKAAEKPAAAVVPGTRMIWPVRGTVLSDFAKNGKGLDIGAAAGSVVVSAGAGEVIFVGSGVKGYGQLVIVRHTPTLVTAYGHNSKIVVQTGDKVKAGQKIAESGNTEAERPMLRFEVRDRGQPVDPMKFLPLLRN